MHHTSPICILITCNIPDVTMDIQRGQQCVSWSDGFVRSKLICFHTIFNISNRIFILCHVHGHVTYQIDRVTSRTECKYNFTLGSKWGQILNFSYKINFKQFYTKHYRKYIERNFHFVAWVMPHGRDLVVLRGQKLKLGDLRPLRCVL